MKLDIDWQQYFFGFALSTPQIPAVLFRLMVSCSSFFLRSGERQGNHF
ncbi:hypothetical protein XBFFR1_2090024 [Xenorhabdus bovienii str. feltiae France]|nr:hypothetical protein XBFFR1_2090024 [Xenorhabdus bovienii str. feltiae France]